MEAKRIRASNFTLCERNLLLQLALKHKNIIENKRTNATTWGEKDNIWEVVAKEYCASTNGPPRDAKCLRGKYEMIKKAIRREAAISRREIFLTGGGPPVNRSPPDPLEEELRAAMQLSVVGLPATFDSDDVQGVNGEEEEQLSPDVVWMPGRATKLLATQKKRAVLLTVEEMETRQQAATGEEAAAMEEGSNKTPEHKNPQPKTPLGTRRLAGARKRSQSSVAAKYERLSEEKSELVSLQKELALKALQHQEEEHKQRMRHADIEHALRVEGLKLENEIKRQKLN